MPQVCQMQYLGVFAILQLHFYAMGFEATNTYLSR